MATKQCSVCSGLGYRDFVGGTSSTTEHCHSCDGTGRIRVADPIESPKKTNKQTKKLKPAKPPKTAQEVKSKNIKLVVSIIVFIAVYMIAMKHVTDSFFIAAGIALVAYFVMYRWFYFMMSFLLIATIAFFFFGDEIFSLFN